MGAIIKFIIALLLGAFSLLTYWCNREYNPVTEKNQHVNMTVEQEIALGLQAAPEMASQYGGLHPDAALARQVKQTGNRLIKKTIAGKTPYRFDFHLLADEQTINAFALPGGQIFLTAGLLKELQTEGQLAGVLGHEIGHVVARHSAEQLAKAQLSQGLSGAAAIAIYDPDRPSTAAGAAAAALIGELMGLSFSRDHELDADRLSIKLVTEAGYDPRAMLQVMAVLQKASSGNQLPEFFKTHPNPENRLAKIQEAIRDQYPNGLPGNLTP